MVGSNRTPLGLGATLLVKLNIFLSEPAWASEEDAVQAEEGTG